MNPVPRSLLLVALCVSAFSSADAAQSGFGVNGLVVTDFPGYADARGTGITIDSAGRVVVSGIVKEQPAFAGGDQFAAARYLVNGDLDASFDGDGRAVSDFDGSAVHPKVAVAVDQAGRVLLAGGVTNVGPSGNDIGLMRFAASGAPDPAFGVAGKVTTAFVGSDFNAARGVVIVNGNEAVIGGRGDTGPAVFGIAAYGANGGLNAAFDTDGLQTTSFASHPEWAEGEGVARDSAGRYIVAGLVLDPGVPPFSQKSMAVARYLPNGSLDATFSGDGRAVVSAGEWSEAYAVTVDAQDRIVLAGCQVEDGPANTTSTNGFAVVRLTVDGELDTSFSDDGFVVTPFGPEQNGCAQGVTVDQQGRIVAAGWMLADDTQFFAVARYDDAGAPDLSFGQGGQVITTFPEQTFASGRAVAVDAQGRIFVSGVVRMGPDKPRHFFGVACYNEYGYPCRDLRYEYAAKIVCGVQRDPAALTLARGGYATTVNIHNPGTQPVTFFKKLALTRPPRDQRGGEIRPIAEDVLKYDQALAVDCPDLQRRFHPDGLPDGYIEGFVVIQSPRSLDVTAVYSTAALGASGRIETHSGIDVERVEERVLGADLSVTKHAQVFEFPFGDSFTFFATLYTIDISNAGPQLAAAVELLDELTLEMNGTVGAVAILDSPLEVPPGASVTGIVQASPSASLSVDIGDIAAGASKQVRFWALAAVYVPAGADPSALLRNIATVSAEGGDGNAADNSVAIETPLIP